MTIPELAEVILLPDLTVTLRLSLFNGEPLFTLREVMKQSRLQHEPLDTIHRNSLEVFVKPS